MLFHTLFDTIYLKGVLLLFPFQLEEFFFELDFGFIFRFEKYSLPTQKYLMTIDHLTDCFFYLFIIKKETQKFSIFNTLMKIQSGILMVFLMIVYQFPMMNLELFIGILYFFAFIFVCFNVYSPIYFFENDWFIKTISE